MPLPYVRKTAAPFLIRGSQTMERPVTKPEQTDFPNSPFDTLDVHHGID